MAQETQKKQLTNEEHSTTIIQTFAEKIPQPNRRMAVEQARLKREQHLAILWYKERRKLDADLIQSNNLTEDEEGWHRYLQFAHAQERVFRKQWGAKDWSTRYLAEMLYLLEEESLSPKITPSHKSFFSRYFGGLGINRELWSTPPESLDPNSLLIHSLGSIALVNAIETKVLGRGGIAAVAFSQDRIVYDRGYVVVFQANELLAAGYPLLKVNEDARDAEILREWRSILPVDMELARAILPTASVPDRSTASHGQISTSFFGEQFLAQIPRLS